jgi:uncharacterized protein YukE
MALKVKSFEAVNTASTDLAAAAKSYADTLQEIRDLVKKTEAVWVGTDADAYRAKVMKAIGESAGSDAPLEKVNAEITSHSKTLSSTAAILSQVSGNITTALK